MLLDTITSDDTVFLQGKFISMAVGDTGTLGTRAATPKGFNSYGKGEVTNLGMYVDLDGFGTGKASTLQDAVAMGAIIERFNIGYSVNGVRHVEGNTQFGLSTITNGASRDLSDGTAARAGWTGTTDDKLKVDQVMTLVDDAKYVKVEITLTNQSSAAMADLRYMRSVDPDQDLSYKNLIKVVEQGGDGKDGALIAAYQPNGNNPFFYYTADDRAKVSTYNVINRDPYADRAYDSAQSKGFSVTADQAININFAVGTLAAGAKTTLVFYMGLTDDLGTTVADIKSDSGTTPTPPPVNLAPVAANDHASTINTESVSGNVLANDKDPEGHALIASLVAGPANGTLKLQADGSFVYTAKAGFVGTDTFTYAASDGNSSDTAKVTLSVSAAAVAVGDEMATVAGGSISGNVLSNDTSGSGKALISTLSSGPNHGSVKLASNGTFTYVADSDFTGTDSFVYSASDGSASDTAKVTITVSAKPNVAPGAMADDAGSVEAGAVLTGNVLANDRDSDGDALTARLVTGPGHGTLALAADGSFVYIAANGYTGADSFTYSASDGKATGSAVVSIDVTAPVPVVTTPTPPTPPQTALEKLLAEHNSVDGSAETADVLNGVAGHNVFYFDIDAKSGKDKANLESNDVLIFNRTLNDGNGDGIITFSGGKLKIDGTSNGDILNLPGVKSLRYMGEATKGAHVYADGAVKPKSAIESLFGDDRMTGDTSDKKAQTFFFDTGLGFDLGHDTIVSMGKKDVIVTTIAMGGDGKHLVRSDTDGQFDLVGTRQTVGNAGHVSIFNTAGDAVQTLEFDGRVSHDGVTYYVYSLENSAAGLATLGF